MPTPRLTNQLAKVAPQASASSPHFSEEAIEAVHGNTYVVRGVNVTTLSDVRAKVGEVVLVQWVNGSPKYIIKTTTRRGSSEEFLDEAGPGVVEQLFLAKNPKTGKQDVWFRNYNQTTVLGVGGDFTTTPIKIVWGANTDVFGVLEGANGTEKIHVWRLERVNNTRVLAAGKQMKVKEKLFTVALSSISVDLATVTAHFHRDNFESYVKLDWFVTAVGDPFGFAGQSLFRSDGNNRNLADVSRTLTIRLTGASGNSAISFTNGSPIPADQIVVPSGAPPQSLKAFFQDFIIDEQNHPVYSVKVAFADWGMWQGNSTTGLTGSYTLLGSGPLTNGGVCFVDACPHLVDVLSIQDFMDHGNPSGIISTHVSETHAVLVDAVSGSIVYNTLAPTTTLEMLETSAGANPYRNSDYTGMPVITPQCYTAEGWSAPNALFFTYPDENVGNVGDVGLLKSERSLFASTPFAADLPGGNDPTPGSSTRWAVIRLNVPNSGYDRQWSDGFGTVCGTLTGQAQAQVKVLWNADSVGVFDRYQVDVVATPFLATGGQVWSFVSVLRTAKRPAGYGSDLHQYGVFLLRGSSSTAIVAYTSVGLAAPIPQVPTLVTGNERHVIWSQGPDYFLTDFLVGLTKNIGTTAPSLQLTRPDFLYSYDEKKRFFVDAWIRSSHALTLDTTDKKFPKEESKLVGLGRLKDLAKAQEGATLKTNHTILDKALLGKSFLTA